MNTLHKVEFLEFLKSCDENETLQNACFRLLCFSRSRDFVRKWVQYDQKPEQALMDSKVSLPTLGKNYLMTTTIGDIIKDLEGAY